MPWISAKLFLLLFVIYGINIKEALINSLL